MSKYKKDLMSCIASAESVLAFGGESYTLPLNACKRCLETPSERNKRVAWGVSPSHRAVFENWGTLDSDGAMVLASDDYVKMIVRNTCFVAARDVITDYNYVGDITPLVEDNKTFAILARKDNE